MTSISEAHAERVPLEPARSVRAVVALREWTDEGLARGTVTADADERLPAGSMLDVLGGIPGETVEVEVGWPAVWRKKQLRHPKPPIVRLVRVLAPASERVAPPCPVFGDCGGCRLQHLPYAAQLAWKRDRVRAALAAHGLPAEAVRPTLGMAEPWGFRNQMRFAVNREGQPGLTAYGTHRVIPLDHCPIAVPPINATLAALSRAPNPRPQVLVRCGLHTGDILVQPAPTGAVAGALAEAGIAPSRRVTGTLRTDGLRERLHGLTFAMRPSSFFQTNTAQAEVMADLVLAHVPPGPDATVADAYCGVGTFAALLAARVGHVIAIEESTSAVRDARENLAALGMENVEVIQGRTEDVLPAVAVPCSHENPTPIAAIVLDPPRLGCQRPVLEAVRARGIPRVVYVSCDPATLARDLAILTGDGRYHIQTVQPLDMFPQTHHIECVAVLDFVRKE
jgi:23S rRNA (uracil1939-C5)-methyltransferase